MSRSKPVIATGYSGNLEFMTPDNSFLMGETPELRNLFVLAGFNSVVALTLARAAGLASIGAGTRRANQSSATTRGCTRRFRSPAVGGGNL